MSGPTAQERRLGWYVGGGLLLFGAAALGPSLVGHNTLLSVDMLTDNFPWLAGGSQTAGHQVCSGDTIDSGMAGIHYVRTELASGHLPNWQNLVAGGSSLGSQPNLGLLNPLSLPYFILPLWLAPAFVKLLQLIVAIGGTFLFLRRHAVGRPASMLAGFVFAVSGFMVMWTNWPQTVVAACIPALFWSVERLVQRARPTDAVLVAIVVASMLLGGFPAVTGWSLYAAAAYLIVRLVGYRAHRGDVVRRLVIAVGGLGLGVMLSAVQLVPFALQYHATDLSYRAGQSLQPLPFGGLATLIAPSANGLCIGGTVSYGGWNAVELVAYIGSAALVLAIIGMAANLRNGVERSRNVRKYFVITVVLVLVLGWGGGYALHLVQSFPVFSGNLIGRIRSLLGFLLAVLAGFGFDALVRLRPGSQLPSERDTGRTSETLRILVVIACWSVLGIAVLISALDTARIGGHARLLEHRLEVPVLLLALAAAAVALAYLRRPALISFAVYLLPALIIVQGFEFFHTVLPGDTRKNFYPVTPTHQFLEANLGSDRFVGIGGEMYPATGLYYGLRSVTGHTFHEAQWQYLLEDLDPAVMQSATFSQLSTSLTLAQLANSPVLDRMSAKYLVVDPADLTGTYAPLDHSGGSIDVGPQVSASCVLPAGQLRGVSVWVANTWLAADADAGETINMTLTAGATTITSGRFLGTGVPAGTEISIAAAGENLPSDTPVTVAFTATGGATPVALAGQPGAVDCAAIRPATDGLKLVFADSGSIVYQRLTSLPRIRWASASTTQLLPLAQIVAVSNGPPADQVVLGAAGPPASGQPATVTVDKDASDQIVATVNASGSGYLVVADAMLDPGWSVRVDGKKADLLPADAAMVAVAVPQGVHRVTFSYHAPGQLSGAILSALAALIMVGVGVGERYRWFRAPARVETAAVQQRWVVSDEEP